MTAPDPRLGEIERRLAASTPGPWGWDGHIRRGLVSPRQAEPVLQCSALLHPGRRDAEFIANAPADVAYLLAELRKRDDVIAKLSDWAGRYKSAYYDEAQDDVVQIIRPVLRAAVAAATGGGE